MKSMKRVLALVLAMVMCLGLATVAMATDNAPTPAGTATAKITVNNAVNGETYKAYKIFGASVNSNGSIVYTGEIPDALKAFFKVENGYVVAEDAAKADAGASPALIAALKTYVEGKTVAATATASGNTVELDLATSGYGYYVVTSTAGNESAIAVTSTNPVGVIYEKNTSNPQFPESTTGRGKLINGLKEDTASIGETLTYSIIITTANYSGEGENATPITSYIVEDTLPDWLYNVTVTDITVTAPGEGQTAESIKATVADVDNFATTKTINIPWSNTTYTNGSILTITYTAVLRDDPTITYGSNGNVNTATVYFNSKDNEVGTSTATVKTYPMTIEKVDSVSKEALAGAKFQISGLTVAATETAGVYKVTGYDSTITSETANAENTTEMTCDTNGKLVIMGLKNIEGGYALTETQAPAGYNKLAEPKAGCGVAVNVPTYTVGQELTQYSVSVENSKGSTLPSTGGIGTTIFYVIGGILVIGAGVLLVTKKRMSHNG